MEAGLLSRKLCRAAEECGGARCPEGSCEVFVLPCPGAGVQTMRLSRGRLEVSRCAGGEVEFHSIPLARVADVKARGGRAPSLIVETDGGSILAVPMARGAAMAARSDRPARIELYTDGGCTEAGRGAWAYVVTENGRALLEESGTEAGSTSGLMELRAAEMGLRAATGLRPAQVTVVTDSRYLQEGMRNPGRRRRADGSMRKGISDREAWDSLEKAERRAGCRVEWRWIKGHSGIAYNEKCDRMVKREIRGRKGGRHEQPEDIQA